MYGSIKEKILELRSKGYNYNQIKDAIGCSKGTISYHCGKGQKEKTRFI
jgi:DNA-binding CsgD family transcriptional regulator